MCTCKHVTTILYTTRCVGCGKVPTMYTGHVGDGDLTPVIAGWCTRLCYDDYLGLRCYRAANPPVDGHVGEWHTNMGASITPNRPKDAQEPALADPTKAVNDHICPSCGNDRVSRSERSCWKCGNPLQGRNL